MFRIFSVLCAFLVTFGAISVTAADYPARDIQVIVPHAAGGGCDMTARAFFKNAKKVFPANINIVNVNGGGGVIGLSKFMSARPDGYTLGLFEINCQQGAKAQGMTKYDLVEDMVPITRVGFAEASLAVKADSPFKTLNEFMDYAKKNPEKLSVSIGCGKGGCWDMPLQALLSAEKASVKSVYMHGGAPARTAALGGHVEACAIGIMEAESFVKSGDLRILANFAANRNPKMPDIPTVSELGYPAIDMGVSFVFFAPKGLSKKQMDSLRELAENCYNDPEFEEIIGKKIISKPDHFYSQQETIDHIKENYARVESVLTDLGMAK